jgi:C1A family cysteine protease
MDWRKMGAVTSIHSQSSCGACWAITATETIESAYYISTGKLYDLSEQEIIICDDTCDMCNGGWPQNAYEYVMNKGGLPKESSYDSDLLMTSKYLDI